MTTGDDWFSRLYADGYRGLLLTAYALLEDLAEAEAVTRDAFAVAHQRRVWLAQQDSPLEWVREVVVRLARRRLRWRALRRRQRMGAPGRETVERLHRLAGLPPDAIASIVDIPVDAVESYLADVEAVCASVRQPVVTRVLARSAQRATRRRMLAAAAVAALLVSVAVPLLRVEEPPSAAAASPPAPPTTGTETVPGKMIYGVAFADAWHGYALRADCGIRDCVLDMFATEDGEHWSLRRVSRAGASPASIGRLYVLGRDELAVDWLRPDDADVVSRVHSTDGGRTWTRVPAAVRGSVAEIPHGATLVQKCQRRAQRCQSMEVAVVQPGSGESSWLTGLPPLDHPFPGDVPAAGGRWWVVGKEPDTGRWTIALSEDGRTWTSAHLAWRGAVESEAWYIAATGDTLYAMVTGELEDGDFGVFAIFRSDDGGRSWTQTGNRLPQPAVGLPVVAADDTLVVNTQRHDTALLSQDSGRTFTEATARFDGYAYWTRAGYVTDWEPGGQVQLSADGVRWRELRLHP